MATFLFCTQVKYLFAFRLILPVPLLLPLFLTATLTGISTVLVLSEYIKSGWICDIKILIQSPAESTGF